MSSSQRILAIGLVVCLLGLGALVHVGSVEHAAHHAHHRASTHAHLLCTWMCSAGQILDASPPVVPPAARPLVAVVTVSVTVIGDPVQPSSATRGPPAGIV